MLRNVFVGFSVNFRGFNTNMVHARDILNMATIFKDYYP